MWLFFAVRGGWGTQAGDDMTSWVVWAVVLGVAGLLGVVGTWFSVRTLRWFSALIAAAAVIAITRYGYGLTHPPSSNLVNAFTSGADGVIEALLRPLWLGQSVPPPGPIGRGVLAFLILMGYRALESWAMRRQAPQLDTSVVGDGQSSILPAGAPGAGSLTDGQRHERLTDELKFRLSAMEIRAPAILPGGSKTGELASIADATGNTAAGLAGAVIRFLGAIWPNPRRIQLRVWVEAGEADTGTGIPAPPETRVTVDLENPRTGGTVASRTVAAATDDEAASMVAGYVARQMFARDPATPPWCYGGADGTDLGAWLQARLERVRAGSFADVQQSREAQIRRMWQAADNSRAAGVVRYELAQLLDLYGEGADAYGLHALRLHAMNRAQYPRFYRGRYRLAMSLQMVSNPARPPFRGEGTKDTIDDILDILRQCRLTTRKSAGEGVVSDGDGSCVLSPSLRAELLTMAAGELRQIRRQLALWRVVRDTVLHRDERAVWLPHWRLRHRQAFRDGVCVAELLVAIRLKLAERELGKPGPRPDATLRYLNPAMTITSAIAGDSELLRWLLTGPHGDAEPQPAAGEPGPEVVTAPDRVRWLPWQRRTGSWQAAYNTACLYAALADIDPRAVTRVVVSLERAISNLASEMERAYDWISRDPDFTAVRAVPQFRDFRAAQERRDYPMTPAPGTPTERPDRQDRVPVGPTGTDGLAETGTLAGIPRTGTVQGNPGA